MFKGFTKIGEFCEIGKNAEYKTWIKNKSEILDIIYLYVVHDEIKYVGETRRGYSRPLNRVTNKVMAQGKFITEEITNGNIVEVYATIIPRVTVEILGYKVESYVAIDIEKEMIKQLNPEWNGRV